MGFFFLIYFLLSPVLNVPVLLQLNTTGHLMVNVLFQAAIHLARTVMEEFALSLFLKPLLRANPVVLG